VNSDVRFRPLRVKEFPDAVARAQASFGVADNPDEAAERLSRRIAAQQMWALADPATDAVLGQCSLKPVDHWFGGRPVPCQHVSGVAVPLEHRGTGVAAALMRHALRLGVSQGLGLSLLFPATSRLYRNLGWEHAGTYTRWRLDARHAPALGPPMRPLGEGDWDAVAACHERYASSLAGPEVRGVERWEAIRRARFRYGLDASDGEGLEAYVLFDHERDTGDWQYTLAFVDWAATTRRGLDAVVSLLGRHGTVGKAATFRGPRPTAWSLVVPEQDVQTVSDFDWMARGLDLATAVGARGFVAGVSGSVTFLVDDPQVDTARGPWRLEVGEGKGVLDPATDAELTLDVRAFGPLFTGYRTARDLAAAGLARGPQHHLDWLTAAFAGSTPTLLDFF
jgi:predicted acetyltransferase